MMSIDTAAKPTISGGPLGDAIYEFVQLHFHWGSNDTCGGENEINNKQHPLELHAVFFKKEYGCFDSALEHSDGLTVLGCLFEVRYEIYILEKQEMEIGSKWKILDCRKGQQELQGASKDNEKYNDNKCSWKN